jgi:hypothetical protein
MLVEVPWSLRPLIAPVDIFVAYLVHHNCTVGIYAAALSAWW